MLKKKQNFKSIFVNEFKNTYNSNIKVTDFIPQDELTTTKKVSISWKYATVFTMLLLMISIGLIGFKMYNAYKDEFLEILFVDVNVKEIEKVLSQEDLNEILKQYESDLKKCSVYYTDITKDISLYIYKGYVLDKFVDSAVDSEAKYEYVYFYAFDIKNDDLNIVIDDIVFKIDEGNNWGFLYSVKETDQISIKFNIIYKNKVKEYVFTE